MTIQLRKHLTAIIRSMAVSRKHKTILKILFVAYLVLLVYFLFFSEKFGRTGSRDYEPNLEPFKEIKRDIDCITGKNGKSYITFGCLNLFGNVVAFIPFGFFLPALFGKWQNFLLVTVEIFLFSLLVEIVQLFSFTGSFDVDDIILNTLGGFLGYIVYRLVYFVYRIVYKITKKGTKRKG